nr:hypothetical protein [uncultured Flavobacterium sp.]
MKAIERLMQYIDFKGFNKRTFEIDNGLSNGYLGKQLSRNADLGEGVLNKILENCPELNAEWLLTGNGEMIVSSLDVENKKPSQISHDGGLKDRYISLLERTISSLEDKIKAMSSANS